jgi:YHS domain-containing protein
MRIKVFIVFVISILISLAAAQYRWGDSGHAIGLISIDGGKARHPSFFVNGKDRYTQITTATVLPPYRGNARVVLEGYPKMDYDIRFTSPVIDLGLKRLPTFRDNILYDLQPGDKLALWILMHPPDIDPICGMGYEEGFIHYSHGGKDYFFCAEGCLKAFKETPDQYEGKDRPNAKYTLAFYDAAEGNSLLKVPLIFRGKGAGNAVGHQH